MKKDHELRDQTTLRLRVTVKKKLEAMAEERNQTMTSIIEGLVEGADAPISERDASVVKSECSLNAG